MTAKTMAEVLAEHGEWRYTNGAGSAIVCRKCGASVENVVEHQAAALSAAGFGLVADTKAEALEEAADQLARLEYVRPDHPNRAAYEKILAVRRGNTDAWLKARAGLIRAAS